MASSLARGFSQIQGHLARTFALLTGNQSNSFSCLRYTVVKGMRYDYTTTPQIALCRNVHTTQPCNDLMEFFEPKDTWKDDSYKAGRPWRMEELRLKSNSDLHKLWYVLLKEMNLLVTMQEEYKRNSELFPNPERLEKVEESMDNITDVIAERDRAFNLLETGKTGEREYRTTKNILGETIRKRVTEHPFPEYVSKTFWLKKKLLGPWTEKYLIMQSELQRQNAKKRRRRISNYNKKLQEEFPGVDTSHLDEEYYKKKIKW